MIPKREGDTEATCLNFQSLLFSEVLSEWKRNVAINKSGKPDTRHPVYKPLCTYVRKYVFGRLNTSYDLHWVDPRTSDNGTADVAFYISKYMLKPSDRLRRLQRALRLNLPEDEYEDIWSIVRCRHIESEALGYGVSDFSSPENIRAFHRVLEHLRKGIEMSKVKKTDVDPIPLFYSPVDGHSSPLARYYKNSGLVMNWQDFLDFFYSSSNNADNVILQKEIHPSQVFKKVDDFDKMLKRIIHQQSVGELDFVYD